MKELKSVLKKRDFKNYYVFYGEEDYLKNYYECKMREAILSNMELMNYDIFNEKEVVLEKVEDAVNTLPFMSEYRLVILKNTSFFTVGKRNEQDKMYELLNNMPSTTIIIFIEGQVDKRNKLFKKISENGLALDFKTPNENELIKWCISLAQKRGKVLSRENALILLRTVVHDMESILLELDKLLAYTSNDEIQKEDIYNICTKSLEVKIFDMVDAIGNKNINLALDIFNNLIMYKESPIMIISMIARQFRIILQCKELQERGSTIEQIASMVGLRTFVVKQCLRQSANYSKNMLVNGIRDCSESDVNIKQGKISEKLCAELLIIKYSC